MARTWLTSLNLSKNELQNAVVQNLASAPSSPVAGQIYYDTSTSPGRLYWWNGSAWIQAGGGTSGVSTLTVDNSSIEDTGTATDPSIRVKAGGVTNAMLAGSIANGKLATDPLARANHTGSQAASTISDLAAVVQAYRLDQFAAPNTDLSANSHKITNLSTPTSANDAANKSYVDAAAAGIDWKASVRAATTANGTLATAFENGDVIDGVTLATGDRILLKNQTTGAENGIYTINASGSPTRATDADASAEVTAGLGVFVSEGTANGNTAWVLTTDDPITLGTTALVFTQFSGPGSYTAGTGLTLTGTVFALSSPVAIANGGTGATDAATARTNLSATTKYATDVGDGSSTAIVVTHSLGTRDVVVSVHRAATPWDEVICDVEKTSTSTVTLRFAVAPTSAQFRVTVVG